LEVGVERALGLREGGKGPVGLDLDFPEVECCAGEPNNKSGTEVRIYNISAED
jgi:hypothetical protein